MGIESDNGSRKEERLRKDLPDNFGSHLMIGMLFGLALVSNPRSVLIAIQTHGIRGGYGEFYKNVRPYISYPPRSNPK